jgi:hypothetical protein
MTPEKKKLTMKEEEGFISLWIVRSISKSESRKQKVLALRSNLNRKMLLWRLPWMAVSAVTPLPLHSFIGVFTPIPNQLTFPLLSFCSTSELHLTHHPQVISFSRVNSFYYFSRNIHSLSFFTCRNTNLIIVARSI